MRSGSSTPAASTNPGTSSKGGSWRNCRSLVAKNFTNPQHVLFYIFSGPDFLYADAFFPSARTRFVMAGLSRQASCRIWVSFRGPNLQALCANSSWFLNSVLSYSFFRTEFDAGQTGRGANNGNITILMVFLARSGKTIYDVSLFDLQNDGSIHPVEDKIRKPPAKGVKIVFSDNVGKKRTLYYFSTDVSEGGIQSSGFLKFCGRLGNGDSFVKSASYLMHSDKFSTIREFIS